MKKAKIKERNGFKLKEKVFHKSDDKLRNYGECIIKEFDPLFDDSVLIFVPTSNDDYGNPDGYEAYVDIDELSKIDE